MPLLWEGDDWILNWDLIFFKRIQLPRSDTWFLWQLQLSFNLKYLGPLIFERLSWNLRGLPASNECTNEHWTYKNINTKEWLLYYCATCFEWIKNFGRLELELVNILRYDVCVYGVCMMRACLHLYIRLITYSMFIEEHEQFCCCCCCWILVKFKKIIS